MATKRRRESKHWEFVVKRKGLLPRPIYLTFASEEEGDAYVKRLEALLDRGVVPDEFRRSQGEVVTIDDAAREYLASQPVPDSDQRALAVVVSRIGTTRLREVDYVWIERWVNNMKREQQLSPTTIRHHVGALARCFDWGSRRGITALIVNPLRQLPRGYAMYSDADAKVVRAANGKVREDVHRDRRFLPGEEQRVRAILAGALPKDRQRVLALPWQAALECLFTLAIESGMRMREMYTLSDTQVDLRQRTVFLDKTKNGDKRQVPLSSPAIAAIKTYRKHVRAGTRGMKGFAFQDGRFFPWWNGDHNDRALRRITERLSQQFGRTFAAAGCTDLTFHDLRHEATSRLFERTTMTDVEISRITGHKDPRVLRRYSNFRGSDLARKLW